MHIHDKYSVKCFNQSRKQLATDLLEENRVKRRKTSTGASRVLDSKDEELIQKAIKDKSTAHGRHHDESKRKIFLQLQSTLCTREVKNLQGVQLLY